MSCELFEFTINDVIHYFTNNPSNITYGGHEYVAAPVLREQIDISVEKIEASITMPYDQIGDFVTFLARMFSGNVWVKIMKYFDATHVLTSFVGTASSYSYTSKKELKINLSTFQNSTKCLIPYYVYQPQCRWELYSTQCGLVKATAGFQFNLVWKADLTNVGNVWTVPIAGGIPSTENFFLYGTIEIWGSVVETLFITKQIVNATTITLYTLTTPFTTTSTTLPARLYMGCDKKLTTCYEAPKSNIDNFGGFPFVPTKNIFKNAVI